MNATHLGSDTPTLYVPDIDPETDTLTAALEYAKAGWYVLPVDPDTKSPGSIVRKGWPSQSSRDPKVIAAWFAATDYSIALHCGRSGAVAFDVDTPDELTDTLRNVLATAPYQNSRPDQHERGHYVFTMPPGRTIGNSTGRLGGAWGEVRGLNGVIVVAPSRHSAGGEYRWKQAGFVPLLPDHIAEMLDDASPAEDAASDAVVNAFIAEHTGANDPTKFLGLVSAMRKRFNARESRHDAAIKATAGATKEARAGYYSARPALVTLKKMFVHEVQQDPKSSKQGAKRTEAEAISEWRGIVAWAVGQALAADLDEVRKRVKDKMPDPLTPEVRPRIREIVPDPSTPTTDESAEESTVTESVDPAQYFSREGLLARDLAHDVMETVTCGLGSTDGRLYVYETGLWIPDDGRILATLTTILGNRYRKSHATNAIDIIRTSEIPRISCEPVPDHINVRNGMIDWRTRELLPYNPEYRSTVQLPVDYDPDAACPRFDQFLADVLPADCIAFMWELIAYTIYSGNPFHIAVLLYGKGRNGKGTLIRVLKRLLGERNVSSVTLYELVENRFRAACLYGKLANLAGDLDGRWLDNTATFKAMTGGDTIQGEFKYGAVFDFTPWALPFYSMNKPFSSADSSEGWWARWTVVPFPNSFYGRENRNLDRELQTGDELRGILARAVDALPALLARGRLQEPASVREAKKQFIASSDTLRHFVDENCELDPDAWVDRGKLYHAYSTHAHDNGSKVMSNREFYNRIEQIHGVQAHRKTGARGFKGIRLIGQI